MFEQRFRKSFELALKSIKHTITIFCVQANVIYIKKYLKFLTLDQFFKRLLAQKYSTDRQTKFKFSDGNNIRLTTVSRGK